MRPRKSLSNLVIKQSYSKLIVRKYKVLVNVCMESVDLKKLQAFLCHRRRQKCQGHNWRNFLIS